MKRFIITLLSLLTVSVLFACSMDEIDEVETESEQPYKVSEYVDQDGCEYLVFYIDNSNLSGTESVAATQKVYQSKGECR